MCPTQAIASARSLSSRIALTSSSRSVLQILPKSVHFGTGAPHLCCCALTVLQGACRRCCLPFDTLRTNGSVVLYVYRVFFFRPAGRKNNTRRMILPSAYP